MLALKYLLMVGGLGMILAAVGILGYDLYLEASYRRALATPGTVVPPIPQRHWRSSLALVLLAWGPILLALSIVVVPGGTVGVRRPPRGQLALASRSQEKGRFPFENLTMAED